MAPYSELVKYTRRPSRLTSTIYGPPVSLPYFAPGWVARATMPPMRTLPVSLGLNGSDTSYCCKSPVPQQATYRKRSSIDKSMSVTSGGTALKPLSTGGSKSGSAGSAGIEMIFFTAHLLPSRYQVQIDDDKSFKLMTQLTKPYGFVGSCAGRNSNTSWCSSPKSISCKCLRLVKSQKCKRRPYWLPNRISGTRPFSKVSGLPHSLVTMVSKPRCHQAS